MQRSLTIRATPNSCWSAESIAARRCVSDRDQALRMPLEESVRGYEVFKKKDDGCVRAAFVP